MKRRTVSFGRLHLRPVADAVGRRPVEVVELVLMEAAKRMLQRRLAEVAEPGEAVAGVVDEAILPGHHRLVVEVGWVFQI